MVQNNLFEGWLLCQGSLQGTDDSSDPFPPEASFMWVLIYLMHLGVKREKVSRVPTAALRLLRMTSGILLVVFQRPLPNLITF